VTIAPLNLGALKRVSACLGADPDLVQGGGGNSSLKAGGRLWIKASGTWLARAEDEEIFVDLDLDRLRHQIAAGAAEPTAGCFDAAGGRRPSIETTLHALMPQPVVLHAHAVNTIAHAVRPRPETELRSRLDGLDWTLVPYRRPGLPLTEAVGAALAERPAADVLILANHGLVVGAADAEAALALTREVERRLALTPRAAPAPATAKLAPLIEGDGWRLPADPSVQGIATDPVSLDIASAGPLYPDHVVFLDAVLPRLEGDLAETIARHRRASGRDPAYLALPGAGVVVADEISAGAEEMLGCLARVLARLSADAAVRHLNEGEVAALVDWEAEQYRRSIDAAPVDDSKGETT
jgi:rhamnose utilization protein RhaD (predicted bifunctional aldolase and dehydrogenase)